MREARHQVMRLRTTLAASILAASAFASQVSAAEVTHGEMAAAIRGANYPCAHVKAVESAGDDAWSVQCNSGTFRVSRSPDGAFTVQQVE